MPPPLPPRCHAALLVVAGRLDDAGVRWVLAGSAGRALLGHRVRPRDIDVEVAEADAGVAGVALGVGLRRATGRGRSSLRVLTEVAGVEVDVTAGLAVEGPAWRLAPDDDVQLGARVPARLGDRTIPVAPPEEALARAVVLGEWEAIRRTASQAAAGDAPPPRIGYVLRRLSSATSRATR